MKFCPRCGTPKTGSFCGGCGFAFAAGAPSQPQTSQPTQAGVAANGLLATPAEWKVDPINPAQERYWDGLGWTNNVRRLAQSAAPISISLPSDGPDTADSRVEVQTNLLYGEDFDPKKNCTNCGEPHKAKATACLLCDEKL